MRPSVSSRRERALARLRDLGLTGAERKLLERQSSPEKLQAFINAIPINFEPDGDTCYTVRQVLAHRRAHCIEAALVAACIDFREGLQCCTDDDCRGLTCNGAICVSLDGGGAGGRGAGGGGTGSFELSVVSVSPVGDDNTDGKLSPGESAGLKILVLNSGTSQASGVTATLSPTTIFKRTSQPIRLRRSVTMSEFVSSRNGVNISLPTAMMQAFIAPP